MAAPRPRTSGTGRVSPLAMGLRWLGRGLLVFLQWCGSPVGRRIVLGTAAALLAAVLLGRLRTYVQTQDRFTPKGWQVKLITPRPDGAADEMLADIRSIPVDGRSLFDPELLTQIRATYQSYPWVAEVPSVRRVLPDRIEAVLRLRWPVGAVMTRDGWYLVDEEGVRLPREYYPQVDPYREPEVPFFRGLEVGPPAVGRRYGGDDLADGIAVVLALRPTGVFRKVSITAVDLANVGGRKDRAASEVVLWTESQTAVEWGRSPLSARVGEPATEAKLTAFQRVLDTDPELRGIRVIRLQFPGPMVERR